MSKISDQSSDDSLLREASRLVRSMALPATPGESVKSCLRRVFYRLETWSFSRVRALWYCDPRTVVRAHEIEWLRTVAQQAKKPKFADLQSLASRIERLEKIAAVTDQANRRKAEA